ncbi:MAG: isoaspartyl peptidase/L-asparaginase [Bacteroidetes bacterium]|nr:isoaspartyl peptidase/L-asparaginase [Bacteroidota bacterium]
MKKTLLLFVFILVGGWLSAQFKPVPAVSTSTGDNRWVLVIHGGAGGPAKGMMKTEKEKQYTDSLSKALQLGSAILSAGGSSLDAVETVIRFMEDCPLFNAGKGSVLTEEGKAEMDASIMDGKSGLAGAVACVTTVKNPVTAARAVMEKTPHVLLIGKGADDFAKAKGLQIVDPSYFITPERYEAWKKAKQETQPGQPAPSSAVKEPKGTVGCVALDLHGNLASGTSTGGMMMKMSGRAGDSPIIGAGTFADNNSCAVSCTGHGEFFIRNCAAYSVAVQMLYAKKSLKDAADFVIFDILKAKGGEGGLIAVDKDGNIAMPFSSNAMFRGSVSSGSEPEVRIY